MIEVVEKVDGEIVEKSYKAIVEEIKRKITNAIEFDRLGKRDRLVILIPEKDYQTLKLSNDLYVFDNEVIDKCKIFGIKARPCQVDRIYVAYDEPEGGVYHE